jgi:hypothetical protein
MQKIKVTTFINTRHWTLEANFVKVTLLEISLDETIFQNDFLKIEILLPCKQAYF